MSSTPACHSRLVCLLFPLLLMWSGSPGLLPGSVAAAADAPAGPTPEALSRLAEDFERWSEAFAAARRDLPRNTFDPRAVHGEVGRDPAALFAWVRDQTHWTPYRGALRGSVGVLMDRLGNSLDRSLLLAELLRSAGHQVRLAGGELSEPQAAELLGRVRPVPEHWLQATHAGHHVEDMDEALQGAAEPFGIDGDALLRHFHRARIESARATEDAVQRVAEQTALLAQMIGAPGPTQTAQASATAEAHRHIRDHWWVQRRVGNRWVDMDVLLPDAEPGDGRLARVTRTIAVDRADGRLPLESDLVHEVVLRVVIEQWKAGELLEAAALEHTLRPAELFGQQIRLGHLPMSWPDDLESNMAAANDPFDVLKQAAAAQDQWLPVLSVGPRMISQSSFMADGTINENPSLDPAEMVGRQVTRTLGGLGGALAGAPSAPPVKEPSHLTAAWIEYELRVPGEPPQTIRRQIFDLVGPARRGAGDVAAFEPGPTAEALRAVSLLGETDLLIQVSALSQTFVAGLGFDTILPRIHFLTRDLRRLAAGEAALPSGGTTSEPTINPLYPLALARQQWRATPARVYHDRPNVLSFHRSPTLDRQGRLTLLMGYDIVANRVAVHRDAAGDAFAQRLEQGVTDTVAEAMLMSLVSPDVRNVSQFMDASFDEPWQAIREVDAAALAALALPSDVHRRIENDLAAGYVVVVPAAPGGRSDDTEVGWWRISPADGGTLGYVGPGYGASLTEYTVKLTKAVLPGLGVRFFDHWCETQGRPGAGCHPCSVGFLGGVVGLLSVRSALVTFKTSQVSSVGFVIGGGLAAESMYSAVLDTGGCIDSIGRQYGGELWRRVHGP